MGRARTALIAAAAVAAGALTACSDGSSLSPDWSACRGDASGSQALARKAQACTAVIKAGVAGADLADALRLRGNAHHDLGVNDQAIADYDQAIAIAKDDAAAFNDRALAYQDLGKLDEAIKDFSQSIALDPSDATVFDNRGMAEKALGRYDAAIRDEDHAIELKPNWAVPWVNRGYALIGKRQFDMAQADFDDALRITPADVDALDGRGQADQGKQDNDRAIQDYGRAIAARADDIQALEGQAAAFSAKGDAARAARDLDNASDARLRQGDYPNSIADADQAVGLAPDDPEALNARCWARSVGNSQVAGAVADCQRSLAIRPNSAEVLDSLGFAYFRQGRLDQSIEAYNAALTQNPQLPSSLFMRGVDRLRQGDSDGGQADLGSARAIDANIDQQFQGYGVTP